jgi:diguanylate cyclase (GGDEF)-like protein
MSVDVHFAAAATEENDFEIVSSERTADSYVERSALEQKIALLKSELVKALGNLREEEQKRVQAEMSVVTDPLTGLNNRAGFDMRYDQAMRLLSREQHHSLYMVMMDLDGFKAVNDTYGHAAGDFALQEVARRLKELFRSTDTIARLGGDEFALLLPSKDGNDFSINEIKDKIDTVFEEPILYEGSVLALGTSVGVMPIPRNSMKNVSPDQWNRFRDEADQRMYENKRARKGQAQDLIPIF